MRPSEDRLKLWPIAVVGFFLVITLLSFHTGYRLREMPPGEFRDLAVSGGKPDPELASAYWRLAISVMQWKFPRGTALPQNPPPEFTLTPGANVDHRKAVSAGVSRQIYWTQLRRLWERPEVWERKFDFDPSWSWKAAQDVFAGVSEFFRMSTH